MLKIPTPWQLTRLSIQLREHLNQIADQAERARHELAGTDHAWYVHGPTGTGKSTVVPWEAMRWLEEHCAARRTKPGLVICSQQTRKVTISLAEEVRRRHGKLGEAVVGYHVSKERPRGNSADVPEAIGVYALINNRELNPARVQSIPVFPGKGCHEAR